MTTLWDLGSVSDKIFGMTDGIPSYFSGATMLSMINGRRLYMENELGVTIGSVDIAEAYHEPLLFLSLAKTHLVEDSEGSDADSVSLGEFKIQKRAGNTSNAHVAWEANGMDSLDTLKSTLNNQGKYGYYKANG